MLFTITVSAISVYSQSKIDSLENLLKDQKEDTVKVRLLNTLGWLYLNLDLGKTTSYENQALTLSKKIKFKTGEAIAITHLGYVATLSGNFQDALSKFNQSLEIFKLLGDKSHISTSYTNIANIHFYLADYSKNIEYNAMSLKINMEIGDSAGIANTYTSLGNAYLKLGDYPKSLDFFMNSLKIYEKKNDSLRMSGCYNNIAIVYKRQSDKKNAMKYYQKALDLSLKFNNTKSAGESYNNIGVLYQENNQNKEAELCFENALSLFQSINYQVGISTVTGNIGQIYMNTEDYAKALRYFSESAKTEQITGDLEGYATTLNNIATTYFKQKNYNSAQFNAHKCLDIASQINSLVQLNRIYKLLADINKAEKNFPEAYAYLDLYVSSSDSLFNIEKTREIENIKTLYEVEKKEIEIESLHQKTEILEKENRIQELQISRNRLIGSSIAGILVLLIFSAVLLINRQRIKIKNDKQIHDAKKALLDVEIRNINLEKHKLNSELEFRKKELTNMASQIIEKNNLIEKIEQEVSTIKSKENNSHLTSLKSISLELNLNKNREDFNSQVEELHKDFFFKLSEKYPDLTRNEKKLAALLRMELSSKEISGLLSISSKSVDMNRYRLRKKLNLDNETNILEFLKTI